MARLMLRMKVSMILTGVFFTLYFGLQPVTEWFERKDLVAAPEEVVFVNTSVCHVSGQWKPTGFYSSIEPVNKLRCRMPQLLIAITQDGSNFLEARRISEDLSCGESSRVAGSDFLSDDKAWLWDSFKIEGYSTAYGEDNAKGILSSRNGDKELPKIPVDFDLTPVIVEMNNHTRYSIDLKEMIHCTAGRKFQDVLRDFVLHLVPYMQGIPFFSVFWQSQGVQEYYEYAWQLDHSYMMLLKKLLDADILNNTLLLLMSDHGLRAGEYRMSLQGMKEESQPLMVAIYPEWLKRKYPLAVGNLESNAHSLITPYDLRETLADVIALGQLKDANIEVSMKRLQTHPPNRLPRGISLFLPIPDHRTCDLAHIPSLFCFCRELTELPTDDGLVLRSSRFMVESINQLIKPFGQCRQLKLEMVLLAYFLDFGEESFVYELRLRVRTSPGNGVYEATVRLSDVLLLTSPISRVSHYLRQSPCIGDPDLQIFCFCI
ncbi:uncharacterized protein LOC117143401 isoform X2 [Drosophila mauritiana]|uniref:Uncharacterized protein LOC117143401 isoform X2 n=1 Tax=Drosophila mauritiana TaxID=7226 RepID=A0A6P8K5W3_DROMA|nr:uncharacterized protein LOC117143401 isoform X2 [Drosophila mauritiana]